MTWSLQLTFWALPPLVAVVVVLRDLGFLLPRHRERGTRTLIVLIGASGVWAALDLVAVVSPSLDVKSALAAASYVPAAAATVAWPLFALVHAGRKELRRWPMLVLYGAGALTVAVVLGTDRQLVFRDPHLTPVGGVVGLEVTPASGFWIFEGIQLFAVAWAVTILAMHSTGAANVPRRLGATGLAGVIATAPVVSHLVFSYGDEWADLTSSGYAFGASLLLWGLLRRRLLDLGPVDPTRVLHELRDPIVVMDGKGRIVDVNRAAERELGLRPYGDVPLDLGTIWASGLSEQDRPTKIPLTSAGDGERWFEVTLTPLGHHGTAARSALLLRDITAREEMRLELQQANENLNRLANTDGLTDLANRRHFMRMLEREVERSDRYGRPLSLVLLDMDDFKKVNDTHGHSAGDDVLRSVAALLRSVRRDVDLAARLGGEELALLLPETGGTGAKSVAERVRQGVQSEVHASATGKEFHVTVSIGVASLEPGTDGEALLQAADRALYQAKEGGRNRVVVAGRRP